MKKVASLIFGLFIIFGCSKSSDDCPPISPIDPSVNVAIVDMDGNSLIGDDNVYKPSEITLSRGGHNVELAFFEDNNFDLTMMTFLFDQMESEKDYFLKLNEDEVEVLNLSISLLAIDTDCSGSIQKILDEFYLNGEKIDITNHYYYVIQK